MNCSSGWISQDLNAFVSLRFDASVLAFCVDDLSLHFTCFALFIFFKKKKKQTVIAMRLGETESYGACMATQQAMEMESMARDLGVRLDVTGL